MSNYTPKVGDVLRQRSWTGRVTVLGVGKYKFLGAREDGNEYIYDILGHDWIKVEPEPASSAATPSDRYVPKVGDRVKRPKWPGEFNEVVAIGRDQMLLDIQGLDAAYPIDGNWIKEPVVIEGTVGALGRGSGYLSIRLDDPDDHRLVVGQAVTITAQER